MGFYEIEGAMKHDWEIGVDHFNAAKFWHAHEAWEQGWKSLPSPRREYLQALIQACGAFCLLEKGRLKPAERVAARALHHLEFSEIHQVLQDFYPRPEIPELRAFLRLILTALQSATIAFDPALWLAKAHALKAKWVISESEESTSCPT